MINKYEYFICVVDEDGDVVRHPVHESDKRAADYDDIVKSEPTLFIKVIAYKREGADEK